MNVAKPKKGSSVAIFGLGAVGLAVSFFSNTRLASNFPIQNVDADAKLVRVVSISQAAEGARIAGASRIIGVDLNSNRFNEGERISIY